MTHWAFAPILNDRINNFAVTSAGSWIAAAGNLGLAVWSVDSQLLWSQSKRATMTLTAADTATLIAGQGMTLTAFEARTGKPRWDVKLAASGEILGLAANADGQRLAVSSELGTVYLVDVTRGTTTRRATGALASTAWLPNGDLAWDRLPAGPGSQRAQAVVGAPGCKPIHRHPAQAHRRLVARPSGPKGIEEWALKKKPRWMNQFWLDFNNGAGDIDQIVLGRTEADLDAVKPSGQKTADK
ncbi:MAG: hypothetical protein WD118_04230 [Phycisphaeraceae bacterium]